MTAAPWGDVAGPGVDPDLLAERVALLSTPRGRELLRDADTRRGGAARAMFDGDAATGTATSAERAVADDAARRWAARGARVHLPGGHDWPAMLDRLAAPPRFLAVRGRLPAPTRPAVAIVGARRATSYGTGVAAWLSAAVADAGGVVVSGGARGIDAAAHGASAAVGTVVVLGCGHDVDYPRPHARPGALFDEVLAGGGCLVAEQLPTTAPRPPVVRARNRIVAALADAVVVVEGGERSGALLTATAAAEIGVDVLAVPGDVRAPGSTAPHRLLREGAAVCSGPRDLLDALAVVRPGAVGEGPAPTALPDGGRDAEPGPGVPSTVPGPIRRELVRRWPRPVHVEGLVAASGLAVGAVLAAVTRGVVAGELAEGPEGIRLRRSPSRETGGRGPIAL